MKLFKALCKDCNVVFVSDDTIHKMDVCPKCKSTAVDIEDEYTRFIGNVKVIEVFEPPWFEDEDDYHSSLMSWLNDSDEEYYLFKEDGILNIVKKC